MASPPVAAKPASRWGSLLQQAVAGVESRLDTILAEEDNTPTTKGKAKNTDQPPRNDSVMLSATTSSSEESRSRTPSTNRKNDRLQEKLAKAMINRSGTGQGGGSAASSNVPSRTASPSNEIEILPIASNVNAQSKGFHHDVGAQPDQSSDASSLPSDLESQDQPRLLSESVTSLLLPGRDQDTSARPSVDSDTSQALHRPPDVPQDTSIHSNPKEPSEVAADILLNPNIQPGESVDQMRSDYETAELRRQEETHFYLERIDALQSKLQYLTKEAAEIAHRAASSSVTGSLEQKLAAKDEKIALLMQEGHKLSQTEFKLSDTVKRLRAKSTKDEKQVIDAKRASERQERATREAQERATRAEISERNSYDRVKTFQKLEKELEVAISENSAKASTISELRTEVFNARNTADVGELKSYKELLEAERRLTTELRDDLSNAKIEREISNDRHRAEIRDLREQADREKERARVTEMELRGEQGALESRLEASRARWEEASSGATGDTQVKLLRQIETLQTQYSVASENWQGIESSLLAKITHLEKERDEITNKEAEMRRKARETKIKSRRLEDELESMNSKVEEIERQLVDDDSELKASQEKLSRCELEVIAAKKELRTEKETWEARLAERLEEEKTKLRENGTVTPDLVYQNSRAESPVTPNLRAAFTDRSSLYGGRYQGLPGLGVTGTTVPPAERPISRRTSTQPIHNSISRVHHRHGSLSTTPQLSTNGVPETPLQTDQQDDFFDGVVTPATPERTINDVISVSTSGAGPSVQLVERMSAAVRRLESEKATSQDELNRLSTQRDEAMEQVVTLMREAEEKRAAEEKAEALQAENEKMNQRYQTTLEMLGEKSELVEELRADVADVKQMYRDLVDSTMR